MKITLDSIVSGFKSVTKLITNFDKIEDDLNNKVLYRNNPEGEPNQMENNLDMNSQRIVNLVSPVNDSEPARWADVKNGVTGIDEPIPSQTGNAKTPLTTNGTGLAFGQIEADHVDFTPAGTGAVTTNVDNYLKTVNNYDAVFDSVQGMKDTSVPLPLGALIKTHGYYTKDGLGGNTYLVVSAGTGVEDGGNYIDLVGINLQAKALFLNEEVRVSQFGVQVGVECRDDVQVNILDEFAGSNKTIIIDVPLTVNAALLPRREYNIKCGVSITANSSFVGIGATGSLVAFRHAYDINWEGGYLDGNNVAISEGFNGLTVSAPQADVSGRSRRLNIRIDEIKNCLADGSRNFGNGGGKGVSMQFGSEDVCVKANVNNCFMPYSIEGRLASDGGVHNVSFDIKAQECTHGPLHVGTTGGSDLTRSTIKAMLHDCGISSSATNWVNSQGIDADISVTHTTGTTASLVAGSVYTSTIKMTASVVNVTDVVNHTGVSASFTDVASRGYLVDIQMKVAGSCLGHIYTHDPLLAAVDSNLKLSYSYVGSDFANLYEYTNTKYLYQITNLSSGKTLIGDAGTAPAFPASKYSLQFSSLDFFNEGVRMYSDASNVYIECEDKFLALRDKNGATQFRVQDGYARVDNILNMAGTKAAVDVNAKMLFVDSVDNKLKYKDSSNVVHDLY